jgi:hypothetical protein
MPNIATIEQVETLLKNQDSTDQKRDASDPTSAYVASTLQKALPKPVDGAPASFPEGISPGQEPLQTNGSANTHTADGEFPWEMIGLGLDEPLPPQDVMNDL